MHTATQEDMFPALARNSVEPTIRDQYNRFRKDFDRLGGILPPRIAATFLGVSRQRMYQLIEEKKVRSVVHQDSSWVSLADVLERIQEPTPAGRPRTRK